MSELQLRPESRYQNGTMENIDGDKFLKRERIVYDSQEPDEYHTVVAGEDLTMIAGFRYKRFTENPSKFWWAIADANPEISNPLDLSHLIGQEILIPNFYLFKLKR